MWTKCIINVCVHTCSTTRRLHTVCLYDRQIRDQMLNYTQATYSVPL